MRTLKPYKSKFFINSDGIFHLNSFFKNNNRKIFILVDSNTKIFCLDYFVSLFNIKNKTIVLTIPSGEVSKSVDYVTFLINELINHNADKDSVLFNLGGGVVSDLGGFVASIFNRGISYVNIPTTLLAQVDASLGGKNGVNFNGIKNKIGLINNPIFTIILTDFLKTLPEEEIISGYGEIFKYGLISNPKLWFKISSFDIYKVVDLEEIIHQSVMIKESIVKQDFYDNGLRKILNFGHTIGHAIESCSEDGFQISHGLSVVSGMICELYISHILFKIPKKDLNQIVRTLVNKFPLKKINNKDSIINFIRQDKKNKKGKFLFSLISKIGTCYFDQEVSEDIVKESLNFYNTLHD